MSIDPGTYRNHLTGEAAYRSFVPLPLWEVVRKKDKESVPWHGQEKITDTVARVDALLRQFREQWTSAEPEMREAAGEILLRREAEASVGMAYPRQEAVPSFLFPETGGFGGVPFSFMNLMSAQQGVTAEPESLLEGVPEELREMAVEDMENLYEAAGRSPEMLNRLPLSGRLLKDLHYIALYAAHYDKMYRGEFRRSPVWIGESGQNLRSAAFVPPVEEEMLQAFSDLETFLHYEETVDPLVKAALIHYQFETIHPFIDGNGRIGRLLTLLYLKECFDLECPWIPLSETLLRGIDRYYKEIRALQLYGDYVRWTQWFLGMLEDAVKRALEAL